MPQLEVQKGESRRFGLDLLRAIAVVSVLFGHAIECPQHVPYGITRISREAILGVELFFVLSGFLIGGLLIELIVSGRFRTGRDLFHFWARRWLRTLPLYYLFLVVHHVQHQGNFRFFQKRLEFVFFLQNFAWEGSRFFGLAWSLSIEEHFYLLFPFLCFFLIRSSTKPLNGLLKSVAFFLLVPLILKGLAPAYPEWKDFDGSFRKIVLLRLDSLMYGVGAAVLFKFFPEAWERVRRWSAVGISLVAGLSLYAYLDFAGLVGSRPLQFLIFPLISLAFALILPFFQAMKRPAFTPFAASITYVSTLSYSLYLSHGLVISFAKGPFLKTETGRALVEQPLLFVPLVLAASLMLAAFTYHFWESPFLYLRARLVPAGRREIMATRLPFSSGVLL